MIKIESIAIDQNVRDAIIAGEGNIIVTANAGSGKTTILTDKLYKDAELETYHYQYLGLTFTNMAVNDIKEKINSKVNNLDNIRVQTIHSFVLNEIVIPFINNKYPEIDRNRLKSSYASRFNFSSYEDGLELVEKEQVLGTYIDSSHGNFLLDLAFDLISNFIVVRQYIVAKYKKIYIDEYQDCDESMHNLFQYFSNDLEIPLFIVGDAKQSIYQWRGASPEYLNQFMKNGTFAEYQLIENFRSVPNIISYGNSIAGIPHHQTYKEDESILYINLDGNYFSNEIRAVIIRQLIEYKYLNDKKEIGVLIGRNNDNIEVQNYLIEQDVHTFEVIRPNELDDLENKFSDNLARCYFNDGYNEFNFIEDVLGYGNQQLNYSMIIDKLYDLFSNLRSNQSLNNMNNLFNFLDEFTEVIDNNDQLKILNFVQNDENRKQYHINNDKISHTLMTTHSAKGKSIEQVVIFTDYYDWNGKFKKEDNYVGITRAKTKLILVDVSGRYADHVNSYYKELGIDSRFESFVNEI